MTEFIYRFRPVSRLLDEDGVTGELDSQYIFFAHPKQLNDPLEGYKDVFFAGDRIVWRNLFRHYSRCLIVECCNYLVADTSQAPNKEIAIFSSAKNSPKKINEINLTVFERLVSEPAVSSYIDSLATDRKVRRHELISNLTILHLHILDVIFEVLHEENMCQARHDYFASGRAERIQQLNKILSCHPITDATAKDYESAFEVVHSVSSEFQLMTRYRAGNDSSRQYWFFLVFEFPECFCNDLDKLIYPTWYTACFMSSCTDSSIWGTYGGHHKDVCLKFRIDTSEQTKNFEVIAPNGFDSNGVTMGEVKLELHQVSYEKSFVDVDFFRSLGHMSVTQIMDMWYLGENGEVSECAKEMRADESLWRRNYWENFYHAATVKLKAWDREQESRLILSSTFHNYTEVDSRKLKYSFNSLEGIIFGINTPLESKLKLISRVESLCDKYQRESFSFYQAVYDSSSKSIRYDRLNNIKVGFKSS